MVQSPALLAMLLGAEGSGCRACLHPPLRSWSPNPTGSTRQMMEETHLLAAASWSQAWGSSYRVPPAPAGKLSLHQWWVLLTAPTWPAGSTAERAQGSNGTGQHFRGLVLLSISLLLTKYHQWHSQHRGSYALVLEAQWGWRELWGKEALESLQCPWQHKHITASCGVQGWEQ